MKICILFLIGFINLVSCCHQNNTDDDPYPVCHAKLFRRKRAVTEYTRWRANLASTPEFIVKILDEDLTTPRIKKIVAVNIQPVTKGKEKIIIGGVMVTTPTETSTSVEMIKDYTRFVPPTTIATRVEGDLYLAPVLHASPTIDKFKGPLPRAKNLQRDESPPASPQFLTRNSIGEARQYAPITPVGFTRRSTLGPLTPPFSSLPQETYSYRISNPQVRRTSTSDDIVIPTRTKSAIEDNGIFIPLDENSRQDYMIRSTFQPQTLPQRSMPDYHDIPTSTLIKTSIAEQNHDEESKMLNKDSDAGYNMLFDYDDNLTNRKKADKDMFDIYDDKIKDKEMHTKETDFTDEDLLSEIASKFESKTSVMVKEQVDEEDDFISTTINSFSSSTVTYGDIVTKKSIKDLLAEKRRKVCSMIKLRQLSFSSPRTLHEIVAQLKHWAENSPVAKWVDITDGNFTVMENPIYMMMVDDPSSGQILSAKQTVMIIAGIQGRDHHAVAAAMYILYQLIERSENYTDLLTKYRFWVIPVFNPDGYDYSMTFPHRREWAKNLRQNWDLCKGRESCHSCAAYGLRCTIQPCYGVNLDRNFEYQWIPAEELRAEHPCGSLYAGSRQLSEPETRAFTKFLHKQRAPIYTFIAFKEGDVLGVMYPYSHTKKKRTFDHVYRQRAARAAAAANSISGRPYVAGQTSEFLPLYAGGIEDWVDGHLGIDNTYTIMMFRPADTYNSKLITEQVVHEAYAAMDTLVIHSMETPSAPPQVVMTRSKSYSKVSISPGIYLLNALLLRWNTFLE